MRVIAAPDSFKGTLSAAQAARAMAEGVRRVMQDADVVECPMADGGEGTLAVLEQALGGSRIYVDSVDPLGRPVRAAYLRLPDGSAVVELAAASGIEHVSQVERTPETALRASTFGTGLVLAAALAGGARRVFLTLGGSATTDGGFGLCCALGLRAWDDSGLPLDGSDAMSLERVARVEVDSLRGRLSGVDLWLAVDVDNPLCGPHGAAAVYGPQKGLAGSALQRRDAALARWAELLRSALGVAERIEDEPGMGAAGGAGFPLRLLAAVHVRRGADWAAEVSRLDVHVQSADLVITGEGRSDVQSAAGKVPSRVIDAARAAGVPCLVVSGALGPGADELLARGAAALYAASPAGATPEEIRANAYAWLASATARAVAEWKQSGRIPGTGARHIHES